MPLQLQIPPSPFHSQWRTVSKFVRTKAIRLPETYSLPWTPLTSNVPAPYALPPEGHPHSHSCLKPSPPLVHWIPSHHTCSRTRFQQYFPSPAPSILLLLGHPINKMPLFLLLKQKQRSLDSAFAIPNHPISPLPLRHNSSSGPICPQHSIKTGPIKITSGLHVADPVGMSQLASYLAHEQHWAHLVTSLTHFLPLGQDTTYPWQPTDSVSDLPILSQSSCVRGPLAHSSILFSSFLIFPIQSPGFQ